MPAGVSNPALGYAAFCVVKICGYSLAARFISRAYEKKERSAWVIGVSRTLIGMVAGALYFGAIKTMSDIVPRADGVLYLVGFLPIRVAEWWFLIWLFYDRAFEQKNKGWRVVVLGTLWSYVIDIPAIGGFILTGGFWIC
jgi:uncharacterized BrkB/YihY/UPF0761 family membrane protein